MAGGGTDVTDPLEIVEKIDPKKAWPGLRLLMVSTTGEDSAWYVFDDDLKPQPMEMPAAITEVVDRIAENCEPALCTVLFMPAPVAPCAPASPRTPCA